MPGLVAKGFKLNANSKESEFSRKIQLNHLKPFLTLWYSAQPSGPTHW